MGYTVFYGGHKQEGQWDYDEYHCNGAIAHSSWMHRVQRFPARRRRRYHCLKNESSKNQIFNITYGNARKINDLIKILNNHFDNLNVTYTWAVSHSCAVPEGSSATISDYNGFKSILNFSRLMITYLDKINLPFHSIINIKGFRGDPTAVHLKSHSFIKKFFDIFAHSSDYNFQSHIFNTLKSSKKDFYIIHLNYTQWKYSEIKDFKKPIETLLNDINKFFKNISNDKYFNNFNFIITADHGFSFDIDDFGYASSHRSEVIEVPFIIIKKKAYENLKLSNSPNIHRPCSFMDFQKSLITYYKNS